MPASRTAGTFLSFRGAKLEMAGAGPASSIRLYCFPYAGGAASVYAPWARVPASALTVYGVEFPGHGSRYQEEMLRTVEDIAASIAQAVAAHEAQAEPGGLFAFYGHSMGAVVAFETARMLEATGRGPKHLFVGAARAPQLPRPLPAISDLPAIEFLGAVQQRYGGLPAALFEEPDLMEMVLPVLRADFRAYEIYALDDATVLACPVTAFCGTNDAVVTIAAMERWAAVTSETFQLETMNGDHFFLNTMRAFLLEQIGRVLSETAGPGTTGLQSAVRMGAED